MFDLNFYLKHFLNYCKVCWGYCPYLSS